MRKIRIGFSRNTAGGIFSKALQWYMGKDYSHVFYEFDTTEIFNDSTIFHSTLSSGVSYWSKFNFLKYNTITKYYNIEIEEGLYKEIRAKLHSHAGEKYAFSQNIGIVLVDLLKSLGVQIRNPFRSGQNCSELIFHMLNRIDNGISDTYNENTIRPDHIEEILNNMKDRHLI